MFRSFHWLTLLVALGLASNAGALPLISEVFYDASGSDNGAVFVEIYGMAGTSLDGFSLEGVNGSNGSVGPVVLLSGSIPIDGFFVVADDRGDGQSDVPFSDWIANFDFQNGPDSIVLRSGATVLDAVGLMVPIWMEGRSLLRERNRYEPVFSVKSKFDAPGIEPDSEGAMTLGGISDVGLIVCDRSYNLPFSTGLLHSNLIRGHTSPCAAEQVPTQTVARKMIIQHLLERGFGPALGR